MPRLKITFQNGEERIIDGVTPEQMQDFLRATGIITTRMFVDGVETVLIIDSQNVKLEELQD